MSDQDLVEVKHRHRHRHHRRRPRRSQVEFRRKVRNILLVVAAAGFLAYLLLQLLNNWE
jgi:hypothetical protein